MKRNEFKLLIENWRKGFVFENELKDEGRLILAGPHPSIDVSEPGDAGFSGSLIVAEFDDLQQARQWADADPYVTAGVYSSVVVKPFNKVLP